MCVFANSISVYRFIGEVILHEFTITEDSAITSAGCCDNFLAYSSGQFYFQYHFQSKEKTKLPQSTITRPYVHTLSSDICNFKEFMYILHHNKKPQSIQHNSNFGAPLHYYGTRQSMYQFYPDHFTRTNLDSTSQPQIFPYAKVQFAAMIGTELLVMTSEGWRIFGSVRSTAQLLDEVLKGNAASVYSTFQGLPEDQCSATMISLLAQLWQQDKHLMALDMTQKFLWLGDPHQLLVLFPQIQLDAPPTQRRLVPKGATISIAQNDLRPDIFKALQATLEHMFERLTRKNPDTPNVRCIATALLQVYAVNLDTRPFSTFMSTHTALINFQLFEAFIYPLMQQNFPLAPCMAVYQTHRGSPA